MIVRVITDIPELQYNNIMSLKSVSIGRIPYKGIIMYAVNAIKNGTVLPEDTTDEEVIKGKYQKVVEGQWQQIANKNSRGCSECGMAVTREMARLYSFCPYCGAKNENKYP